MKVVRVRGDISFWNVFGGSFEKCGGSIGNIGGSSEFFGGTNKTNKTNEEAIQI